MKKNKRTRNNHSRYVDKEHLLFVSRQECFVKNCGGSECNGPIQVHHLLKPSDKKKGLSFKAGDDQTIPLCMHHHSELHTKFGDEFKFFQAYGKKNEAGQEFAKLLFQKGLPSFWEIY